MSEVIISSKNKESINNEWKKKLADQDQIAKRFYDLCNFIVEKYTTDIPTKFKVFLTILKNVQKLTPHYAIKTTGPFFWKFKDQISEGNVDWIHDYDFEKQMEDWEKILNKFPTIVSKKLEKITESVRDNIKIIAKDVPPEKGALLSQHLLKWYCSYNSIQKEIDELSNEYKNL